jgi:hypothetical protein
MRERAEELGGVCTVTAAEPHGTRVKVRLPGRPQNADAAAATWIGGLCDDRRPLRVYRRQPPRVPAGLRALLEGEGWVAEVVEAETVAEAVTGRPTTRAPDRSQPD